MVGFLFVVAEMLWRTLELPPLGSWASARLVLLNLL